MIYEYKENFDEIARFESSLEGPVDIINNNSLRVKCVRFASYEDHPLSKEKPGIIENCEIFFIFNNVYSSEKIIRPYRQNAPFERPIWYPDMEIRDITPTGPKPPRINEYDLSEFNYGNPCEDVVSSFVMKWKILAESFVLSIDM